MPPVFHRQAEADGYGWARRAVPPEVPDGKDRPLSHGGPTPPGARTGGGGRPRVGQPRDRAEPGQAETARPRACAPGANPSDQRPPRPPPEGVAGDARSPAG